PVLPEQGQPLLRDRIHHQQLHAATPRRRIKTVQMRGGEGGATEAYSEYAAGRPRLSQRSRWAVFIRLLPLDGVAAVDGDGRSGDEIGRGARQEDGDARHVLHDTPAAGGGAAQHRVVQALDLPARVLRELGI